jgi:hypothetical protein
MAAARLGCEEGTQCTPGGFFGWFIQHVLAGILGSTRLKLDASACRTGASKDPNASTDTDPGQLASANHRHQTNVRKVRAVLNTQNMTASKGRAANMHFVVAAAILSRVFKKCVAPPEVFSLPLRISC